MTTRAGIRDGVISAVVFATILFALVSIDPRVKAQAENVVRSTSASSLIAHAGNLGGALASAARDKSLDSAPLLVFAAVGTVLTLFMLRS
jgi:hypothetical protein